MHRYFFDIVTSASTHHDFHGRKMASPDQARELAEMIALDIECRDDPWVDTEVVVRDVGGARLYAVSVRHPDLVAS